MMCSLSGVDSSFYSKQNDTTTTSSHKLHDISVISNTHPSTGFELTDSMNNLCLHNQSANNSIHSQHTLHATSQSQSIALLSAQHSNQLQSLALPFAQHSSQSQSTASSRLDCSILNEGRWDYRWVVQHHSLQSYPHYWKHPVELLLNFRKQTIYHKYGDGQCTVPNLPNTESYEQDKMQTTSSNARKYLSLKAVDKRTLKHCVYSPVPKSLPLNCVSSHLHVWNIAPVEDGGCEEGAAFLHGRIKVICVHGIIYRYFKNTFFI